MLIRTRVLCRCVLLSAAVLLPACTGGDGAEGSPGLTMVLSGNSLAITEGGTAGVVVVSLGQAPHAPVTISITASSTGIIVTPDTLMFTADNFDLPRAVTVAPVDDNDLATDIDSVAFDLVGGAAREWVRVTKADDDVQGVIADSTVSMVLVEGGSVPLGFRLAFQPQRNDTVTVSFTSRGVATAIPSRRIFTPADWNVPQIVNVSGLQDLDAVDDVTVLRFSGFNGAEVLDIDLTVLDDD